MKGLRILPGAAGLIALTATIGFVDGRREIEAESISRIRISQVIHSTNFTSHGNLVEKLPIKPDGIAYLVEFKRGYKCVEVLVDAVTGKIMKT